MIFRQINSTQKTVTFTKFIYLISTLCGIFFINFYKKFREFNVFYNNYHLQQLQKRFCHKRVKISLFREINIFGNW